LAEKEFSKAEELLAPDLLEYISQYGELQDLANTRYYDSKCVEIRIEKMEMEGYRAWVS
jgi:hypothetical protein